MSYGATVAPVKTEVSLERGQKYRIGGLDYRLGGNGIRWTLFVIGTHSIKRDPGFASTEKMKAYLESNGAKLVDYVLRLKRGQKYNIEGSDYRLGGNGLSWILIKIGTREIKKNPAFANSEKMKAYLKSSGATLVK